MSKYEHTPRAAARRRIHDPRVIIVISLALLSTAWGTGCAELFGGITYYDSTSYKTLTETKAEVLLLYDTFASDTVNMTEISAIRLKLAQAYEYEKGKGEKNKETYVQSAKIQGMFERHVRDRIADGKWNEANLVNKKENIGEAFDIAIRTERLKNKNE